MSRFKKIPCPLDFDQNFKRFGLRPSSRMKAKHEFGKGAANSGAWPGWYFGDEFRATSRERATSCFKAQRRADTSAALVVFHGNPTFARVKIGV